MFLDALKRQNPRFIECAAELLKSNQVLPDTYIIDVEQFVENARVIRRLADKLWGHLYAMTKQFGRNPFSRILIDGIEVCCYLSVFGFKKLFRLQDRDKC